MKFLNSILQLAIAVFGVAFAVTMMLLPAALVFAQDGGPSGGTETLQQCVDFFTKGTPVDWVLGGVFLIVTVLGLFFRSSILSIILDVVRKIMGTAKK